MTSREFVYWLQGFFELSGANELNLYQVEQIKRKLKTVFEQDINPYMGPDLLDPPEKRFGGLVDT